MDLVKDAIATGVVSHGAGWAGGGSAQAAAGFAIGAASSESSDADGAGEEAEQLVSSLPSSASQEGSDQGLSSMDCSGAAAPRALTRRLLVAFYRQYDQSKLEYIDAVLANPQFTDLYVHEFCLWKYGASPTPKLLGGSNSI